jgi:hypothetical protein
MAWIDTAPRGTLRASIPLKNLEGNMLKWTALGISLLLASAVAGSAQTRGEREEFNAIAIMNNELGAGTDRVIMRVNRWSTEAEQGQLTRALMKGGSDALMEMLRDQRSVGTIRTPDTLAYDLRYAHQEPGPDGGRVIVLATDRPISFWEAVNRPRISDYPFTVIQMQMGAEGEGKGTLSLFTKIRARGNMIELENFATSPVMLTKIESRKVDEL